MVILISLSRFVTVFMMLNDEPVEKACVMDGLEMRKGIPIWATGMYSRAGRHSLRHVLIL